MSNDLYNRMLKACEQGDLSLVRELVAQGAFINGNTADADPPLVRAADNGHLIILTWLLENGADVNILNKSRSTALMCAAYKGHVHCAALLMEHGADIGIVNQHGKTATQYAREYNRTEVLRVLQRRPDEISNSWTLDNRVMQEIYDFRRLERVTLVRKSLEGDVEAMQREAFSQLADRGALQKAFDEHRRRGGKRSEDDVFDGGLRKTKLSSPHRGT